MWKKKMLIFKNTDWQSFIIQAYRFSIREKQETVFLLSLSSSISVAALTYIHITNSFLWDVLQLFISMTSLKPH